MAVRQLTIEEFVDPIVSFLIPLFFVLIGTRIELAALFDIQTIAFAGVLTLAATAGKLVCGLGCREEDSRKWVVGLGMVPRGEFSLVIAALAANGATTVMQEVIPAFAVGYVLVMSSLGTVLMEQSGTLERLVFRDEDASESAGG